jgi:hypothetical protein
MSTGLGEGWKLSCADSTAAQIEGLGDVQCIFTLLRMWSYLADALKRPKFKNGTGETAFGEVGADLAWEDEITLERLPRRSPSLLSAQVKDMKRTSLTHFQLRLRT